MSMLSVLAKLFRESAARSVIVGIAALISGIAPLVEIVSGKGFSEALKRLGDELVLRRSLLFVGGFTLGLLTLQALLLFWIRRRPNKSRASLDSLRTAVQLAYQLSLDGSELNPKRGTPHRG